MEVKPAILELYFEDIEARIEEISQYLKLVQIDMCDGDFVPSMTYAHAGNETALEQILLLLVKHDLDVEYDLMVNFKDNPLYFERWMQFITFSKPKRVIIHMDSMSEQQLKIVFDKIDERSTKIYLGLGLTQDILEAEKLIAKHTFKGVQVMGIEKIGFSGEPFSPKTLVVLERLSKKHPELHLMVDGGVSLDNAHDLALAGADSVATNSSLFKSLDLPATIGDFLQIEAKGSSHNVYL